MLSASLWAPLLLNCDCSFLAHHWHRIVGGYEDDGIVEIRSPDLSLNEAPRTFTFDKVFANESTQRAIYDVCAAPVVQSVLEGYNGTIFAFGQTGSGKVR